MRVLVTRPEAQCGEWLQRLEAAGIEAAALPLVGISAAPDPGAVTTAWGALHRYRVVMFVSPNAAEQFFALRPADSRRWPEGTLAASPGPGTTRALIDLGVSEASIVEPAADASQFDSASLWQALSRRAWHGQRALIVRGASGRDLIVQSLRDAGATVDLLTAYRRTAPVWAPAQHTLFQQALDAPGGHLWWFSSAEAIDRLIERASGEAQACWPDANALATHPRIAERARVSGFGRVELSAPQPEAVIAAIMSMMADTRLRPPGTAAPGCR